MNLKDQVKKSLFWKKSDEICARKLNITVEQYRKVKAEIKEQQGKIKAELRKAEAHKPSVKFDENLKNKEALLEYNGPKEIKTKEDLVRECNIDLSQYQITRMIHNAWGKDGNQNYQVKAWLEPIKLEAEELLAQVIQDFEFSYTPQAPKHINQVYNDPTVAVLSLQDIHIGKQNIDGIYDISESVKKCIENLILRSYHSSHLDKIIFVLGGDLLNVDTYNGTTTSGTPVENAISALEMYREAYELMFWSINYLKQFCNQLEVVYIPGNHDRLSSGQLAFSLSKVFNDVNIIWNIAYAERKAIQYGNNMICFEHGDVTINKSFFVFATEYPEMWGQCKFRTLYSGHYHKDKKVEYVTADEVSGFSMRILPSLTRSDRYHQVNKWTGNKRGGIIELHSKTKGPVGTFSYYE